MNYAIAIDEQSNIYATYSNIELWDGFIEITELQYIGIEFDKYNYTYIDGEIIRDQLLNKEPQPIAVSLEDVQSNVTETKGVTTITSEDALTIMEYQTVLDEKLSKIITHLGL